MRSDPCVILALDGLSRDQVKRLVEPLQPSDCRLKVGKELFTRFGPHLVRELQDGGFDVFLDLKFHDIPNTVAAAVAAAADLGVWMVNVHALGGPAMLAAAQSARQGSATLLTAVTILTSHNVSALQAIGLQGSVEQAVRRLAEMALSAGLDGLVCSAQEAAALRQQFGPQPRLVTPGIRPAGAATGDQVRTATPREALSAGATDLVIGRPLTRADNPLGEIRTLNADIAAWYREQR